MQTQEHLNLNERARLRAAGTWVSLDWGGLLAPLADQQADLDAMGRASIENFMAISDEAWGVKEGQRDRSAEVAQAEIDQDRQIAIMKSETGLLKLSIRKATDEYELAAKVYDAKVKGLVMAAREFAALVEQEQLALEALRAGLAISKEELRQKEIRAKIYYEIIQRAQVEADLAKAQVEVAKSHVRAIMADIEAGEAEIKVIDAEVQVAMAEAERATLRADVASIFAEILTKQLSEIKLQVGQEEIRKGFEYIATRLADELAIWDTRINLESIQASLEADIQDEVAAALVADKSQEDLRETEMQGNIEVFAAEREATAASLTREEALRQLLVVSQNTLNDARISQAISRDDKETWARHIINAAQRYVHKHSERGTTVYHTDYEFISGE